MKKVTIELKQKMIPSKLNKTIYPTDFYFDAYSCIRYFTDLTPERKDNGQYVIKRTVHIIPLSSIEEIIIENDERFELECK